MHNYSVSLDMKRLKNSLLLINTQHYSSRRNTEAGATYQGCLPSCELHIHSRRSLSGGLAKWKFVDCACELCNLEIALVCYPILRLERNLKIAQIPRFCGMYTMTPLPPSKSRGLISLYRCIQNDTLTSFQIPGSDTTVFSSVVCDHVHGGYIHVIECVAMVINEGAPS